MGEESESQELHRKRIQQSVERAIALGCRSFAQILCECRGADPRLVKAFIELPFANEASLKKSNATASLLWGLPAPDPYRAQWWFTPETIDFICGKIFRYSDKAGQISILALGLPTLAVSIASKNAKMTVLDNDRDVVKALGSLNNDGDISVLEYDVADDLPEKLKGSFDVAAIDAPWYYNEMQSFLIRATEAVKAGGLILSTFPSELTRHTVAQEKKEILRLADGCGLDVESIEPCSLRYVVPRFEEVAYGDMEGFTATPWRTGDLFSFRKRISVESFEPIRHKKSQIVSFSRSLKHFRVFLKDTKSKGVAAIIPKVKNVEEFSQSVSRQSMSDFNIWTTEKDAILFLESNVAAIILREWSLGKSKEEATKVLTAENILAAEATRVITDFDNALGLWLEFDLSSTELSGSKGTLTHASDTAKRETKENSDGFRSDYQRDRDRILWSSSLRSLAHKAQVFPVKLDDQVRQRLAHSIEVLQLASTIGASLQLDRDLIEAGALAHDLGHPPFGHAGEAALNKLFNQIDSNLYGFNHYEHGVDIVRYLEGSYYADNVPRGLNLTSDVAECIFKHMFRFDGSAPSYKSLWKCSKHKGFIAEGYPSLEGQAIRVADKVSYLISDLEDGIRLGAIRYSDLMNCQIFHMAPLDFREEDELYETFLRQRRWLIKLLMEDIIIASTRRLKRRMISEDVRKSTAYYVNPSDAMSKAINEVWQNIQKEKLHKDSRVIAANSRAAQIVSGLAIIFAVCPELIDAAFLKKHQTLIKTPYMRHYLGGNPDRVASIPPSLYSFFRPELQIDKKLISGQPYIVSVPNLIAARDYVVSLTDNHARHLYAELIS